MKKSLSAVILLSLFLAACVSTPPQPQEDPDVALLRERAARARAEAEKAMQAGH